jgi:Cu/Ag efflux pump CusA
VSVPAVSEGLGAVVAVFAFVVVFAAFGLNFVGSNFTPKLPNHLVLTLATLFGFGFEPEVLLGNGMSGEVEEYELVELVLRKRSYANGS